MPLGHGSTRRLLHVHLKVNEGDVENSIQREREREKKRERERERERQLESDFITSCQTYHIYEENCSFHRSLGDIVDIVIIVLAIVMFPVVVVTHTQTDRQTAYRKRVIEGRRQYAN